MIRLYNVLCGSKYLCTHTKYKCTGELCTVCNMYHFRGNENTSHVGLCPLEPRTAIIADNISIYCSANFVQREVIYTFNLAGKIFSLSLSQDQNGTEETCKRILFHQKQPTRGRSGRFKDIVFYLQKRKHPDECFQSVGGL